MRAMVLVLATTMMVQAMPARAQGTAPFRKTMADCEAIGDAAQRLACFDAAAARLRTMSDRQAFRAQEDSATFEHRRRGLFGLSGRSREDEERRQDPEAPPPLKEIQGEVLARAEGSPGVWLIVVKDGGTWQTETQLGFQPPRAGETVKVRRGAMGGYLMDVGSQPSIRVTRLN